MRLNKPRRGCILALLLLGVNMLMVRFWNDKTTREAMMRERGTRVCVCRRKFCTK